jgi:hypothetical protein
MSRASEPHISRRRLLAALGAACLGARTAADEKPAGEDPLYARVLSAYRGQLNAQQLEALAQEDPGPALYIGPETPAEWGVARLFGTMPDAAHAELRAKGYLKWRASALPAPQRALLEERVKQHERRGEGPYPFTGKDSAFTGFARVELPEVEGAQYCWWVSHPKAKGPGWLTLVRVERTLTQEYADAHKVRLAEVAGLAETPLISRDAWVRVKEPVPEKPTISAGRSGSCWPPRTS